VYYPDKSAEQNESDQQPAKLDHYFLRLPSYGFFQMINVGKIIICAGTGSKAGRKTNRMGPLEERNSRLRYRASPRIIADATINTALLPFIRLDPSHPRLSVVNSVAL
jgi:hypothetical protein